MPVEQFPYGVAPEDIDTPIWRFLEFWKFKDLLTGRLYFHRSDLFEDNDSQEGLPLDNYQTGRHPLDINDIQDRNHELGFDAQIRQGFYLSCWYLAKDETAKMWHTYAQGKGVAVCSTYRQLREAMDVLPADDKAHIGLVQYGDKHIPPGRRNLMMNIGTKRERYQDENEVRAMLWLVDPNETGNRNIDIDNRYHDRPLPQFPTANPRGVWRPVHIATLLNTVIVSPFADASGVVDAEREIAAAGHSIPVEPSDLTSRASLIPTAEELKRLGL